MHGKPPFVAPRLVQVGAAVIAAEVVRLGVETWRWPVPEGQIMISDGIKVARIQAQSSPLINSTWKARTFLPSNALSTVKQAVVWANPRRGVRRQPGRHAAPSRTLLSRQAPRLPAH